MNSAVHGPAALTRAQRDAPALALAACRHAFDPGQYLGTVLTRVHGVQYHEPRILHPAVGIDEGLAEPGLEGLPGRMPAKIDALGARQEFAPAQVIVEEQAEADDPGGPQALVVRQHKAQRPDDVRCSAQQHLAFDQGLAHQAELVVLEVAQAAVNQLGAGRGRGAGQIAFFAKQHREAAAGRIARDTGTVDAAANYDDVHDFGHFRKLASPTDARFAGHNDPAAAFLLGVNHRAGRRGLATGNFRYRTFSNKLLNFMNLMPPECAAAAAFRHHRPGKRKFPKIPPAALLLVRAPRARYAVPPRRLPGCPPWAAAAGDR